MVMPVHELVDHDRWPNLVRLNIPRGENNIVAAGLARQATQCVYANLRAIRLTKKPPSELSYGDYDQQQRTMQSAPRSVRYFATTSRDGSFNLLLKTGLWLPGDDLNRVRLPRGQQQLRTAYEMAHRAFRQGSYMGGIHALSIATNDCDERRQTIDMALDFARIEVLPRTPIRLIVPLVDTPMVEVLNDMGAEEGRKRRKLVGDGETDVQEFTLPPLLQ